MENCDDRCHLFEVVLHVAAFDGGEGCARDGSGCLPLSTASCLYIEIAIPGHDVTTQDAFYSTSVED